MTPPFDVVVAGGGPAGVVAAVAAARTGARVLLIERGDGLGGNVRCAHVHSICGLYQISGDSSAVPANGGLAWEFARRLQRAGGACGPYRFGKLDILLQEPEKFSAFASVWASEADNLTLMLRTKVLGAEVEGDTVGALRLQGPSGAMRVAASAFVEATGDGDLAARAGPGWERAEAALLQRPAYIFGLSGVEAEALSPPARLSLAALMVSAVRQGRLGSALLGAVVRPTCQAGLVRVTLDLPAGGPDYDPCDEGQIEALTVEARRTAKVMAEFLRSQVPGFAQAQPTMLPQRIGIRENRRVTGRKVVTAEDILSGSVPDDTVCFSAWPLELHEVGTAMRLVYPRDDKSCGVPLEALRSRDASNVFLAGRCLSATHEAQAALRVIGTAMSTGQAAGMAAAHWAQRKGIDLPQIRAACGEGS